MSDNLKKTIEAVLFAMGESVSVKRMAEAFEVSESLVLNTCHELQEEYENRDCGVRLIELDGSFQMCTPVDCYDALIKLCHVPKKHRLTDVMLETLSIVAYRQPVTRQEIEAIRGVKSDFPINKLLEYNLIMELGRKDVPGRPVLFGTTEDFLRCFGVTSADDLPVIGEEKIEEFRQEAMSETGVVELDNL